MYVRYVAILCIYCISVIYKVKSIDLNQTISVNTQQTVYGKCAQKVY